MILYGASGHAKVIIDTLELLGKRPDFIVDDNESVNTLLGYEVRRNSGHYDEAIVSIGDGRIRKRIVERLDVRQWATAIHPQSVVSSHATVGAGTVVMAGAVVNSGASIGKHCIINTGATIDHDVTLGDYVHIAPGVHVSGGVTIGEGTWIGVGTCVKQGVQIGEWTTVGAGSVVVRDIPGHVTAFGCPCRVKETNQDRMKSNENERKRIETGGG